MRTVLVSAIGIGAGNETRGQMHMLWGNTGVKLKPCLRRTSLCVMEPHNRGRQITVMHSSSPTGLGCPRGVEGVTLGDETKRSFSGEVTFGFRLGAWVGVYQEKARKDFVVQK